MDVREYMRSRYMPPDPSRAEEDIFLCPSCDDPSGHFKIWVGERLAWGYCVRCGWPPEGERDLYGIIAGIEGLSKGRVREMLGMAVDAPPFAYLQDTLRDPKTPPLDVQKLLGEMDLPIREVLARAKKEAAAAAAPVREVLPAAAQRYVPDTGDLKLWRSWFPSVLKAETRIGRKALAYLTAPPPEGRGFDRDMIRRYHVRYAELGEGSSSRMSEKFHGRVMLPVFAKGRLVFCQGRSLLNHDAKYDSPFVSADPKKRFEHDWKPAGSAFFGLDDAWGMETLVLVEGIFDAMRVGPGGLALLGKGMNHDRLQLLAELKASGAKRAVLWLDTDVTAAERNKILSQCERALPTLWTVSRMTEKKDAAEMTPEEARATLSAAQELSFEEVLELDDTHGSIGSGK